MPKLTAVETLTAAAAVRGWTETPLTAAEIARVPLNSRNDVAVSGTRYTRPADWPKPGGIAEIRAVFSSTGRLVGADSFDRNGRENRSSTPPNVSSIENTLAPPDTVWQSLTFVPPPLVVNPSISVDSSAGALTITINGDDAFPVYRAVLDPWAALALVRELTNQAAHAAADALSDLAVGECPTCKGVRLVPTTTSTGRESNERCPECGPRYEADPREAWLSAGPMVEGPRAIRAALDSGAVVRRRR